MRLTEVLPESVAFAAYEFIVGPLLENPHRIGKRLRAPLADRHSARRGTYRIIYRIDDVEPTVIVLGVLPRSYAYRPG
jgi:mRNA interferase RelE/StbE